MNEPILKKAMDTLEFLSQDREARRLYEERQKYLHDEASMIEWATEKGIAQGIEKGLVEGEKERRLRLQKICSHLGLKFQLLPKQVV
nr:hypothetical protein [Paenibacillus sp. VT-400]